MKKVVIWEHENYRGRTEQRYQIMTRTKSRNGLNHVFSGCLFTLEQAISTATENGWEVEKIGDFYEIV